MSDHDDQYSKNEQITKTTSLGFSTSSKQNIINKWGLNLLQVGLVSSIFNNSNVIINILTNRAFFWEKKCWNSCEGKKQI